MANWWISSRWIEPESDNDDDDEDNDGDNNDDDNNGNDDNNDDDNNGNGDNNDDGNNGNADKNDGTNEEQNNDNNDYEARKDYQRLTALILSDFEWKLLDKLIETLTPIESATQFLGGQKYCTLSLIFFSIQILKFDYTPDPNISVNSDENNEENNEENLHLEIEDEFAEYLPLSSDDDINSIINSIKKGIYDALFEYWNIPPNSTLLAGLLDPRSKIMYGWSYELQELAKLLLNAEYEEYKDNDIPIQIYPLSQSQSQSFSSRIFGPQIHLSTDNELTQYLDNFCTPQASPDTDIFKWWIDNREKFPTLFKVARKYLGILATSVSSERLFSDAGNQITSERNRLKAETVNEILFLKRNMEYINPFK
ncbi:zinc finger BED domain-containing protein 1-like [Rhizophagus clarus]|uniref:Zinc finger BED domain-containing protein 1-like n=1 Tax=Rhizophagus clarus TaxID=94130 RepID=A0A8H3KUE5_9GLOM|nr:zinc finger BED domain-containing protein 1-like [Rhizophagus clarus]